MLELISSLLLIFSHLFFMQAISENFPIAIPSYSIAIYAKAFPSFVAFHDSKGTTPLKIAVQKGKPNLVKVFLELGADPNCKCNESSPPIIFAAIKGSVELGEILFRYGADLNGQTKTGKTPLIWACTLGRKNMALFLISSGANVNLADNDGSLPLLDAANKPDFEDVVVSLLEKGAKVNVFNTNGLSPLHCAAMANNVPIMKILISNGANLEAVSGTFYFFSDAMNDKIAIAAKEGKFKLVGSDSQIPVLDVNIVPQSPHGFTPLQCAVKAGKLEATQELLSAGANQNVIDENGKSIIDLATESGNMTLLETLKKN